MILMMSHLMSTVIPNEPNKAKGASHIHIVRPISVRVRDRVRRVTHSLYDQVILHNPPPSEPSTTNTVSAQSTTFKSDLI